jgi:hypothetical protein
MEIFLDRWTIKSKRSKRHLDWVTGRLPQLGWLKLLPVLRIEKWPETMFDKIFLSSMALGLIVNTVAAISGWW